MRKLSSAYYNAWNLVSTQNFHYYHFYYYVLDPRIIYIVLDKVGA